MHAYDKCGLVWEREIGPDSIQWGWCTKAPGHDGPHGRAGETPDHMIGACQESPDTEIANDGDLV